MLLKTDLKMPNTPITETTKNELAPDGTHPFMKIVREYGEVLKPLQEPIFGREKAMQELDWMTSTRRENTVLLIAPMGTGKTFLVRGWAKHLERNGVIYNISLSKLLGSDNNPNRQIGEATASEVLANLPELQKDYQDRLRFFLSKGLPQKSNFKVAIFLDELHKLAQMNDGSYAEALKESLGGDKETAPIIAATTDEEYNQWLFANRPFTRRFTEKRLPTLDRNVTLDIGRRILNEELTDDVINGEDNREAVLNTAYNILDKERPDLNFPSKMNVFINKVVSYVKLTGEKLTPVAVKKVIGSMLDVDLMKTFDIKTFEREVPKAFFGQELAKSAIISILKAKTYGFNRRGSTYGNLFFIGTTGVGKTQLAKLVAQYAFNGHIQRLNMVNYMEKNQGEQFLTDLGNLAFKDSACVFLIDEIEKASAEVWQKLLVILDEGTIEFRLTTGQVVSLSLHNSMFIATSNLGDKIMDNIKKADKSVDWNDVQQAKEAYQNNKSAVHEVVKQNFSPEFSGRFTDIVMFTALTLQDKIDILELLQRNIQNEFHEEFNIKLEFPPRYKKTAFLEGDTDGNTIDQFIIDLLGADTSKGARQFESTFKQLVEESIVSLIDRLRMEKRNESITLEDLAGRTILVEPDKVALGKVPDKNRKAGGFVASIK